MTQIAAFEKMINLDAEMKLSTIKTMAGLLLKIDSNGKNKEIDLIEIPLQLGMIGSKIESLETVVFLLIFCLIDIIIKE